MYTETEKYKIELSHEQKDTDISEYMKPVVKDMNKHIYADRSSIMNQIQGRKNEYGLWEKFHLHTWVIKMIAAQL